MIDLQHFKDHFVLLLEAGFIAINQADEDSATKLFKAATLLNPDSTLPEIGFGYLHLHKLELKNACKIFEGVLHRDPHNEVAKTLLGISLSLTPDQVAKGEKFLTEIAASSRDTQVKKTANDAIDFVDKFVKKGASPVEVQEKKKEKKK